MVGIRRARLQRAVRQLRTVALVVAVAAQVAQAAQPHEHGVARLDVAVDAGRVSIELDTPLDNLLGFERAPRTDAERDKATALVARLRAADALFRIDAAAGCTLLKVDLRSAALQLSIAAASAAASPAASPAASEHSDLNAVFEFRCKNGTRAGFVEVGLFDAFAALKRIELQVVTPRGQLKATLRKPASRVMLVR